MSASSPSRDARSIMLEMRQQADHFLRVFVPSRDDAGAGACVGLVGRLQVGNMVVTLAGSVMYTRVVAALVAM